MNHQPLYFNSFAAIKTRKSCEPHWGVQEKKENAFSLWILWSHTFKWAGKKPKRVSNIEKWKSAGWFPVSLYVGFSLVQFSRSVVSNCLLPHEPQHARPPFHHQHPESTQTHVHWVSDAIQPSHPLSSPSPPALNLSQHQDLFKWVSSSHQVAKVLEFLITIFVEGSFHILTDGTVNSLGIARSWARPAKGAEIELKDLWKYQMIFSALWFSYSFHKVFSPLQTNGDVRFGWKGRFYIFFVWESKWRCFPDFKPE